MLSLKSQIYKMSISIWRLSHMVLAISSAIFLLLASITGIILAFEPISESSKVYSIKDLDKISLAENIYNLKEKYPEVLDLEITASDFVIASVINKDGESQRIYIDPRTGENLGQIEERSAIYSFATTLHRSLFLKGTGRFFVGLVSLILCFIAITGVFLLAQRQGGFLKLFSKVKEENFEQRYHVILGKWLIIPIIIISATGVYLSAKTFDLLPQYQGKLDWSIEGSEEMPELDIAEISFFKNTSLAEVRKLNFPFTEFPEDYYEISLNEKEVLLQQYTGEIISEVKYPFVELVSNLSLQLHTGQGNPIWAIVLLISSASIPFFIFSGFVMTYKRWKRSKNITAKFDKDQSEYIILVGSETGNTNEVARSFYTSLLNAGKSAFISSLNEYTTYNEAKHLIVFTATYGDGDAPSNARHFKKLFKEITQTNHLKYSIVGFGSLMYEAYCGYAIEVEKLFKENPQFSSDLPLIKINEESESAIKSWFHKWNDKIGLHLEMDFKDLESKKGKVQLFKVKEITDPNSDDTFLLRVRPKKKSNFRSGDLIAIQPNNGEETRQYSISKSGKDILLSIKKHTNGYCSPYLCQLKKGEKITGCLQPNKSFNFPINSNCALLISNGTGIAPFLGMLEENENRIPCHLFWGGRTAESFFCYKGFIEKAISEKRLSDYQTAFSKDEENQYVQDLLLKNKNTVANALQENGNILICGSLSMQQGVLEVLEQISQEELNRPLSDFENNGQLAMDCY